MAGSLQAETPAVKIIKVYRSFMVEIDGHLPLLSSLVLEFVGSFDGTDGRSYTFTLFQGEI